MVLFYESGDYSMEEALIILLVLFVLREWCLFHGGSFDYSVSVVCSTGVVIIPWRKL